MGVQFCHIHDFQSPQYIVENCNASWFVFLTGRALRKVDELRHLLDIAKMNFRQLGGILQEDEKEREEEREHSR